MRSADDEAAGRIDVELRAGVDHRSGHDRVDDRGLDLLAKFVDVHLRMLSGHDHGVDSSGTAIQVLNRNLALAIRTEEPQFTGAPNVAELTSQLMGQHNGQRHQLGRLVAGVTEHETLVASAASVHAHGDIARLSVNEVAELESSVIETNCRIVVADVLDGLSCDVFVIDLRLGRNFSGDDTNVGRD